jgi:hypothetical protein
MPLNWLVDEEVADGNTYRPPKDVTLEASGLNEPPNAFQVFRIHDSAIRQVMRHIGIPELTPVTEINAAELGDRRYQSDREWSLPVPRGAFRRSAAFVFLADAADHRSGVVYSARKARADVSRSQGLTAKAPSVPVSAEVRHAVDVEITYAVDPDMNVRVLTGAELAEHVLNVLVEEVGHDDPDYADVQARIAIGIDELRETLPTVYEPPYDWELETPSTVHGEAGETSTVEVMVNASSVGTGYFALSLSDPSDPDGDEVSTVWAVDVVQGEEGLEMSIIADFDRISLPLPVFA